LIFSKKEITGNIVTKEGNVGRRILDHVCNTIGKSTHHKGGSCLQLHLYNNNKNSERRSGLGRKLGKKEILEGEF
jgi:hypothetical protein